MNLLNEQKISLTELARREQVNISTCWRWAQRGVRGVVLETYLQGGRRFTTAEAFARFVERTTAAADGLQATTTRPARQRQAAIARAERECKEAGI